MLDVILLGIKINQIVFIYQIKGFSYYLVSANCQVSGIFSHQKILSWSMSLKAKSEAMNDFAYYRNLSGRDRT